MSRSKQNTLILVSMLTVFVGAVSPVFANGGPFVIKYPDGDPAAKGVLARLDPDLKPTTETRLKVVKEDLAVIFEKDRMYDRMYGLENSQPPLANVSAKYTIENPTDEAITVDFGFPILRGVYTNPFEMMPTPAVNVTLDNKGIGSSIISNSAIYGIIRQRAQETIAKALEVNASLNDLVTAVKTAKGDDTRTSAQQALSTYLINTKKWDKRDAILMAQYAGLDISNPNTRNLRPPDRSHAGGWWVEPDMHKLLSANLGPLAAIGEQKATQFFAKLAGCFDADAATGYEAIFAAWGGDVQERSVDIQTGKVRPREITVDEKTLKDGNYRYTHAGDPAIYARVDYLDENAPISDAEKEACWTILKNLPVVFTFAPMNILHYQVTFKPNATQDLTVAYKQYAYKDTHDPASYQLAYVVHPASLWEEFGPINLKVTVPEGVSLKGCEKANIGRLRKEGLPVGSPEVYTGTVKSKKGEIYLAVSADSWNQKQLESPAKASGPSVEIIRGKSRSSVEIPTTGRPLRK